MKIKILIILFVSISNITFSQDYMDDIATKGCECLKSLPDSLENTRFNMELGACMIEAAKTYKKKLKRDYDIDFEKIDTQGEELGRLVGIRMATICPDILVKAAERSNKSKEEDVAKNIIEGKVTNIIDDKFVEFSIKDENGKVSKYYWLTFIESNVELTNNYKSILDENVRITFFTQEFFDGRISEYRTFNIIQKLEKVDKK